MSEPGTGPGTGLGTEPGTEPGTDPARLTVWVRGHVQGVGFRWWVRSRALELRLVGHAANLIDGRVEVVAEGDRADLAALLVLLTAGAGPGRTIGVNHRWSEARGTPSGFTER